MKEALPTRYTTRVRAFTVAVMGIFVWYLLIRKMQLGIPMTMINGGMIAITEVSL
jgi:hypothetical protein